jgi:hypothetical protein
MNITLTDKEIKALSPFYVLHEEVWRTPLYVGEAKEGDYRLWVDEGFCRLYDNKTLPDPISVRLAILNARKCSDDVFSGHRNSPFYSDADDLTKSYSAVIIKWKHDADHQISGVGWRYNVNYYCLELPDKIIRSLRGEDGNNNDTGSESQSEGKKDP